MEGYGTPACPHPPMGGHRPLSPPPGRCAAGPLPCPPRPAEGSSALPCAVGQRSGRGGDGLPGPPRTSRAGRDCIVGRETGAPPGRTPGTASCSSARPAARSGRQEPGLARAQGAGPPGRGGGRRLGAGRSQGSAGRLARIRQKRLGASPSPATTPPDAWGHGSPQPRPRGGPGAGR